MKPTVAVIRETTLLTDALVQAYVAAQQIQVDRDFEPMWSLGADLIFVPPGGAIPAAAWEILLLDHSDQADALGYHDDTGPGNVPRSKVFVADCLRDGLAWSVTASHECLEMLGDPNIDQTAVAVSGGVTYQYAKEVADACEDDSFAYPINGVHLSDFVLPSWFQPSGKAPFTFRRNPQITAPLGLAEGGYIGRRELSPAPSQWDQLTAQLIGPRALNKAPSSRTMRRFLRP